MDKLFTEKISEPGEPKRYRYFLILIIVIIVLVLIEGKHVLDFKPGKINVKGLIIYIVVIIVLFELIMKWYNQLDEDKQNKATSLWSVLHFCFYFGLAYFIPNNWVVLIPFMVSWELFEDFMGYRMEKRSYIETDGKKMFDIVCNSTGYWIGTKFFAGIKRRGGSKLL